MKLLTSDRVMRKDDRGDLSTIRRVTSELQLILSLLFHDWSIHLIFQTSDINLDTVFDTFIVNLFLLIRQKKMHPNYVTFARSYLKSHIPSRFDPHAAKRAHNNW